MQYEPRMMSIPAPVIRERQSFNGCFEKLVIGGDAAVFPVGDSYEVKLRNRIASRASQEGRRNKKKFAVKPMTLDTGERVVAVWRVG